ncbi:unnamed protein product [Boreogadus saida]
MVEKNWGKRNFGLDTLKTMLNHDMEEKGIVLRELSCRTAAEASAAVRLPEYTRRSCRRVYSGSWTPGVHPPELPAGVLRPLSSEEDSRNPDHQASEGTELRYREEE